MNKINLLLKILIVLVFVLFFSIIGVTKKTIDSYNNKDDLEDNIDNLRGIIWANYTFITVSLAIALTIIIAKKYYQKYKWTVLFSIFFILLNTGLNVFEELTIKEYETVEVSQLNNVYIITSVMNILYFILFVRLIKIVDDICEPQEYTSVQVDEYIRNGPAIRNRQAILNEQSIPTRGYVPNYIDEDDEPSYSEGAYGGQYRQHALSDVELTSDDVEFDEDLGITFKPSKRTRTASF